MDPVCLAPKKATNVNGQDTIWTYDRPVPPEAGRPAGRRLPSWSYEGLGNPRRAGVRISATPPAGVAAFWTAEPDRWLRAHLVIAQDRAVGRHRSRGRGASTAAAIFRTETLPFSSGETQYNVTHSHDALDREIKVTLPDGKATQTSWIASAYAGGFDAVLVTDPKGGCRRPIAMPMAGRCGRVRLLNGAVGRHELHLGRRRPAGGDHRPDRGEVVLRL